MNDDAVFSTRLTLPYSAVNANGRVNADWLLNAFQDAAFQQCHALGISGFDMAKKKLKWVVAQYRINIHDAFHGMMPLILKTWRAPWKNLYEIRQFSLGSEQGCPLVTATSVWILIRSENGKPVRLSPHMPPTLMQEPAQTGPDLIRPADFDDFSDFDQFQHETCFPVSFLDLDLNQHVNNRVYLRWAVESLPEPYCFEYTPMKCRVVYRREGLFGDQIQSRVKMILSDARLSTEHSILRQTTGEELARISLEWKKISLINLFTTDP